MDELLDRVTSRAGIPEDAARKAVVALLSYIDKNGSKTHMAELYAAVPGAESFVEKPKGFLAGLGIGGMMAAYAQLKSAGLSTEQMQKAGEELLAFAREKAGNETVDGIIDSVPALRQLF